MVNNIRQRVSAVIVKGNEVLLIKRIKQDKIYYVFPGGGVETGESLEQALVREINEELSLIVTDYKFLFSLDLLGYGQSFYKQEKYQNNFYLVTGFTGQPAIGGPEKERMNKDNVYGLVWFNKEDLSKLPNLQPTEAVSKLVSLKLIN